MPDIFADITAVPTQALETIANVLELRASIPQQQEMRQTYLRDIDFPPDAKVLEIGCGTGAVARAVAAWPNVGAVVGVDPSPYLVEKARTLSFGVPNLVFEVGDGKALRFQAASLDVVILHTVLTHVTAPEAVLAEAHRVLRSGGWMGDLDPLEICVKAFVDGFVNDRWLVRRMSRLAADAGFEVSPLRSYALVETARPVLTVTWVDRGADVLESRGQIGQELAAALKTEARRRAEINAFFGYMAYASMTGRKLSAS